MRQLFNLLLAASIAFLLNFQSAQAQVSTLTFKVDMTGITIDDPTTMGIRGDVAPLSWTETYTMNGPDENGIYEISIPFKGLECGTEIQYKYYFGDDNWDNDHLGENGNRTTTVCCGEQQVPMDTWNQLDEFAMDKLLTDFAWDQLMMHVYVLGNGKERGLTLQEIAQENIDFWEWPNQEEGSPQAFLYMDEFNQAKSPFGYFEVIENSPDKVEYIMNKDWEIMLYMWNKKGKVKNVRAEEMTTLFLYYYQYYTKEQGLTFTYAEEKDRKMRVTISK